MKKVITLVLTFVVATASFGSQPRTRMLGILPYLEQSNLKPAAAKALQDVFVTELVKRVKGTGLQVLSPKATLARFKAANINPAKYLGNPRAFTGSDEELRALVAWVKAIAPKDQRSKVGRVVVQLIDTSTGEIVWADEFAAGNGRDLAKRAADGLAAEVKSRRM